MNTSRLFQVLSGIHSLSDDFKKAIERRLTLLSLPKHYMLVEGGDVAKHAYFLNSGLAMSYTFLEGNRLIESFWISGQVIVSTRSFFEQLASGEFIELMDKSEVLSISHSSVLQLFDTFPEAHIIYRGVMNQYFEGCRERIRDMQNLTAVKRYKKLIHDFPHIEQHIAQEYIASYVGIAPQSLSRIKRQSGRI